MSQSAPLPGSPAYRAPPPIGEGPMNRLAPKTPSAGNTLAPAGAMPQQVPAQPTAPMPPPTAVPVAGLPPHPADDMPRMAQAVALAAPPEEALRQAIDGQEHTVHALGTLLRKSGDITQADLNSAMSTAIGSGRISKAETLMFSKNLPSTSNQTALRAALEKQMERSIRTLVVAHGEAQRRGIDLTCRSDAVAN